MPGAARGQALHPDEDARPVAPRSRRAGGFGAERKPVRKPGGPACPCPTPSPSLARTLGWADLEQPGLEASTQAGLLRDLPGNGKLDSRRRTGISSLEKSDV